MTIQEAVAQLKDDMVTCARPVGWRGTAVALNPFDGGILVLLPTVDTSSIWHPKVSDILADWEVVDLTVISDEIQEDRV